jgi:hypothetical protein
MGIVVAVLDSGGPKWLLAAAGFVAAVSTVALVLREVGHVVADQSKITDRS